MDLVLNNATLYIRPMYYNGFQQIQVPWVHKNIDNHHYTLMSHLTASIKFRFSPNTACIKTKLPLSPQHHYVKYCRLVYFGTECSVRNACTLQRQITCDLFIRPSKKTQSQTKLQLPIDKSILILITSALRCKYVFIGLYCYVVGVTTCGKDFGGFFWWTVLSLVLNGCLVGFGLLIKFRFYISGSLRLYNYKSVMSKTASIFDSLLRCDNLVKYSFKGLLSG